jgi:uncharacterized RmlC-like cupin family protein
VPADPRRRGFHGKQGLDYFAGVSAESAGSRAICMHIVELPPGASARPHYHEAHETAIFMLEGVTEMRHGPDLEQVMRVEDGDFLYIPAGVPHQPYNPTDSTARAVIAARTRTSRRASSSSRRIDRGLTRTSAAHRRKVSGRARSLSRPPRAGELR